MLKKLFRTVFTLVGAGLGYGVFAVTEYLFKISRYSHIVKSLSQWQEMGIAFLFVIIFGFIFFKLTPLVNLVQTEQKGQLLYRILAAEFFYE